MMLGETGITYSSLLLLLLLLVLVVVVVVLVVVVLLSPFVLFGKYRNGLFFSFCVAQLPATEHLQFFLGMRVHVLMQQ